MNRIAFIFRTLWWLVSSVFLLLLWSCADCGHAHNEVYSKQGNHVAMIEEECCGGGCSVTIKLREKGLLPPLRPIIFEYDVTNDFQQKNQPWTHDPVVVWLSEEKLEITVDRVGHISRQLAEAHGIKISYRIGSIDDIEKK